MSESHPKNPKRLRSEIWFNDTAEPGETAIYLERFSTYGLGRKELQAGRPMIGIAQTGGDLTPCNRIHVTLAARVRDGMREGSRLNFRCIRSRKAAGVRPRLWTAIWLTSGWSRSCAGIRWMAWC